MAPLLTSVCSSPILMVEQTSLSVRVVSILLSQPEVAEILLWLTGMSRCPVGIDESGGGLFQIALPDDPKSTASGNTSMAYVLEITEWTAGE